MAKSKGTHSRSKHTRQFPQVKGKIVSGAELFISPDESILDISFQDKTSLSFTIESCAVIMPEIADWKSGTYKPLKRWRPIHSRTSTT